MKNKVLHYASRARKDLQEGVEGLAKAVTATLGPNGRNVIIDEQNGYPVSTKDGVTVAKSISFKDNFKNVGAQLVKQAAIKTADEAGDGTTTSTVLAASIFSKGIEEIQHSSAVEIKRGIDQGVEQVVQYLESMSKEIEDEAELKQVATISANNDVAVGEIISTAMEKVGIEGVITVEESKSGETYLETVEGMQLERGYKSPYFVTDNSTMSATLNEPLILITDKRISAAKDLLPIMESCSSQNRSLLVIADDIDGEALSLMVVNKARGILQCAAVKAPQFGDRKKHILEDIATLTGGKVISSEKGMRMDRFNAEWLGRARKVTIGKDTTTLIDGKGEVSSIEERVGDIKSLIDSTTSPYEKEQLQDRLGRLVGGVAVVHVGGSSEVEMKEKKDRVEDALHATRAALQEGILPGGGVALLRASAHLENNMPEFEHKDRRIGWQALRQAIAEPFNYILYNAGKTRSDHIKIGLAVQSNENFWYGYNPRTDKFVDMLDSGIVDPAKVTRLALQNAASVAGTMLITECIVTVDPDEDTKDNNEIPMGY